MEIVEIKNIAIRMNKEEKESLKKIIDILTNIEIHSNEEMLDELESQYEKYIFENASKRRMLTNTIDFLGMLAELEEE